MKLQTGEYISLVKVETFIKEMPIIENVCIVANSLHSYVVALVVPNSIALANLAEKMGKINGNHNVLEHNVLCHDKDVAKSILGLICDHCKQSKHFL